MNDHFIQYLGLAAGVCTSVSLLPQIFKIVKEKKARDISVVYLLILLLGLFFGSLTEYLKTISP